MSSKMITFQPNCTSPDTNPVGFVHGCGLRSTLSIAWSCTSIIILSTWSILNLTVPGHVHPLNGKQKRWMISHMICRKLIWMFVMLMFPEYLLAIGCANLYVACKNNKKLQGEVGGKSAGTTSGENNSKPCDQHDSSDAETEKLRTPVEDVHSGEKDVRDSSATQDEFKWTLEHTILADMGGIAIRFLKEEYTPDETTEQDEDNFLDVFQGRQNWRYEKLGELKWSLHNYHAKLAKACWRKLKESKTERDWVKRRVRQIGLGDTVGTVNNLNHVAPFSGHIWVVDSNQLIIAKAKGIIKALPDITLEDIADKSKSDNLVKALAITQIAWLITQLIVRLIHQLPTSILEVSTLAFAVCAVVTYFVEWHKTKDAMLPIYVDANPDWRTNFETDLDTFRLIAEAAPNVFPYTRAYGMPQSCVHKVYISNTTKTVPFLTNITENLTVTLTEEVDKFYVDKLVVFFTIISTTLFGGIHLLAWNFEFPSRTESILWKVAALSVAVIPSLCALAVFAEIRIRHGSMGFSVISAIIFAPLYVSSRCFLLVESFRALYYMPPEALVDTWVAYAPHIS